VVRGPIICGLLVYAWKSICRWTAPCSTYGSRNAAHPHPGQIGSMYTRFGGRSQTIRGVGGGITPVGGGGGGSGAQTYPGGKLPVSWWWWWRATPICRRLFWHFARLAASRTFWMAGRSRPTSTAMIAITTSSSISVNPRRRAAASCTASLRVRVWRGWVKSPGLSIVTRAAGAYKGKGHAGRPARRGPAGTTRDPRGHP
jgi:hypothetical protein